jgi:hypothetical protein
MPLFVWYYYIHENLSSISDDQPLISFPLQDVVMYIGPWERNEKKASWLYDFPRSRFASSVVENYESTQFKSDSKIKCFSSMDVPVPGRPAGFDVFFANLKGRYGPGDFYKNVWIKAKENILNVYGIKSDDIIEEGEGAAVVAIAAKEEEVAAAKDKEVAVAVGEEVAIKGEEVAVVATAANESKPKPFVLWQKRYGLGTSRDDGSVDLIGPAFEAKGYKFAFLDKADFGYDTDLEKQYLNVQKILRKIQSADISIGLFGANLCKCLAAAANSK